jgi:hypothetical protein
MKQIKLTQQDINKNPLLKKIGAVAGQTMEYSFVSSGKAANESTTNEGDEEDEEDGNGGNHPGKKPGG